MAIKPGDKVRYVGPKRVRLDESRAYIYASELFSDCIIEGPVGAQMEDRWKHRVDVSQVEPWITKKMEEFEEDFGGYLEELRAGKKIQESKELKKCMCDMTALMRYGCRCGGV